MFKRSNNTDLMNTNSQIPTLRHSTDVHSMDIDSSYSRSASGAEEGSVVVSPDEQLDSHDLLMRFAPSSVFSPSNPSGGGRGFLGLGGFLRQGAFKQ
ncbi:hypothetical protein EBR25_06655 [bacterium]|nr:hypothetical protein [bacterium]